MTAKSSTDGGNANNDPEAIALLRSEVDKRKRYAKTTAETWREKVQRVRESLDAIEREPLNQTHILSASSAWMALNYEMDQLHQYSSEISALIRAIRVLEVA